MNKATINLFCLLCATNQLEAQIIYERTYPGEFPSFELPIELSDTSTFSMASIDYYYCVRFGVSHIDAHGNIDSSFTKEAFSSGYHWIGHDSVLIWYEDGAWDVGPDYFRISLWTPGEIINLHTTNAHYEIPPFRKYGAFLYTPEQMIFQKTDTLYLKNLITSFVEDSVIIPGISSILEFGECILIFRKSGLPMLIDKNLNNLYTWQTIVDLPFDTAQSVTLDSFFIGKDENNSTLLQLINVYDESIKQLNLAPYFSQIEEVQSNKGFLFVKGNSANGPLVLQLDRKFQVLKVSSLDIPELDGIKSLRYYPDRVYAWGYQGLGQYNANYRICYAYQKPEPIRLVNLKLDSMWIQSIKIVSPTHPIYADLEISCIISNLSLDTIHAATLHYDKNEPYSPCFTGVNAIHFHNLNILPGANDTVLFQSYSVDLVHGNGLDRKYFLEHGNHQLDGDTSNNFFVLNFTITGAEELQENRIGVYPNPFKDYLKINDVSESSHMILFDQTGRQVSSGYGQLDNLSYLPAGIYVLQVISGHSIAVNRVVKVE